MIVFGKAIIINKNVVLAFLLGLLIGIIIGVII
jgi:hypothetical protein